MGKLSRTQALRFIKRAINEGSLLLTKHARQRMKERKIDISDVMMVLKTGNIFDEPEPHPVTGEWVYKVEGKNIDGENISVNVTLKEDSGKIVIITVYRSKG